MPKITQGFIKLNNDQAHRKSFIGTQTERTIKHSKNGGARERDKGTLAQLWV